MTQLARWCALLGGRPFASFTDDDVFHALEELSREPARVYYGKDADGAPIHRAKPGKRSPSTVNRYLSALAAVCTWAIKRRHAPRGWEHPCRKIERTPEKNAVVRFLSDAERERLLEACKASSWPRLYLLVLMAITTGARRRELLGLTWGDLDLERAQHMSERLGYKALFVEEFYSCRIGFAKPDVAYFTRVLKLLDLPSQCVLFIDDRVENVDAAKRAGLAAVVYNGESGADVLRAILSGHGVSATAGQDVDA